MYVYMASKKKTPKNIDKNLNLTLNFWITLPCMSSSDSNMFGF